MLSPGAGSRRHQVADQGSEASLGPPPVEDSFSHLSSTSSSSSSSSSSASAASASSTSNSASSRLSRFASSGGQDSSLVLLNQATITTTTAPNVIRDHETSQLRASRQQKKGNSKKSSSSSRQACSKDTTIDQTKSPPQKTMQISNNPAQQQETEQQEEQVLTSLQVNSRIASLNIKRKHSSGFERQQPESFIESFLGRQTPAERRRGEKFKLDPAGQAYHHWSMVVSLAFLYNFWAISYRFSFHEIVDETVYIWFSLDYSADLIYLVDIFVQMRTGYLDEGVLQTKASKIRQHYCDCTRFYLDCLCLLPLDILYLSFGYQSLLRVSRLVKIYKFWYYTDRTERHTNYPNVYRTFKLVHYTLVIFHWNACLFYVISKNKIIDIDNLYKIDGNQCDDILCQYLHAFYWSILALTTVGDLPRPRNKGEYLYVTIELFFGLFLFATVLGHVANIVTNVSAAREEFQAKLDAVKTFMRMHRVSDELQSKVIRWFDYLWTSQQNSDEERSVACLPDRLKAELAIHVHLDTLKRVDIFQNTEAGFLCELVLRLKPVLFSPGDFVCRKNEVGHEMYIVSRGILEVVANEGKLVVATLKAGSYFGEISVLNLGSAGNKRTASVRSVGYSDLLCLNKQDIWDVLKSYPQAEARIRARAEERLIKLNNDEAQDEANRAKHHHHKHKHHRHHHHHHHQPHQSHQQQQQHPLRQPDEHHRCQTNNGQHLSASQRHRHHYHHHHDHQQGHHQHHHFQKQQQQQKKNNHHHQHGQILVQQAAPYPRFQTSYRQAKVGPNLDQQSDLLSPGTSASGGATNNNLLALAGSHRLRVCSSASSYQAIEARRRARAIRAAQNFDCCSCIQPMQHFQTHSTQQAAAEMASREHDELPQAAYYSGLRSRVRPSSFRYEHSSNQTRPSQVQYSSSAANFLTGQLQPPEMLVEPSQIHLMEAVRDYANPESSQLAQQEPRGQTNLLLDPASLLEHSKRSASSHLVNAADDIGTSTKTSSLPSDSRRSSRMTELGPEGADCRIEIDPEENVRQ